MDSKNSERTLLWFDGDKAFALVTAANYVHVTVGGGPISTGFSVPSDIARQLAAELVAAADDLDMATALRRAEMDAGAVKIV